MAYSMIFDTSTMKQQLKDFNRDYRSRRVWDELYTTIDIDKRKALTELQQDYNSAMAQAYASAYESNRQIMSSNLGQGFKEKGILDTNAALEQAYETYKTNYASGMLDIEQSSAEAKTQVDELLNTQAENMSKFADMPYQYLSWVYDQYSKMNEAENIFLTDDTWKKYTEEIIDAETGESTGEFRLKSWDTLATDFFDKSGNITVKGADFYDRMFNELAQKTGSEKSFGRWLHDTDEDLYNWSTSYNPYDYTEAGTNLGSFKTMVGLTSTDEQYSFIERFGGMSKSDIDSMFSKFTSKMNELSSSDDKATAEEYKILTSEIKSLADNLGITDSLENDLGMSLDELVKNSENLSSSIEDPWANALNASLSGILGTAGAAGAVGIGAKLAGTTLKAIPGVGWIIAAIGAISSISSAVRAGSDTTKKNAKIVKQQRQAYDTLVTGLTEYAYNKNRKANSEFYKYSNLYN